MINLIITAILTLVTTSAFADKNKTWEENVLASLANYSAQKVTCGDLGELTVGEIVDQKVDLVTETPTSSSQRIVKVVGEDVVLVFSVARSKKGPRVNPESFVCTSLN